MMLTEAIASAQTAAIIVASAFMVGLAIGILGTLEFMRNK